MAFGDRPWTGKSALQRKDNERLARAIERFLGMRKHTLNPSISTVKRGRGRGGKKSVDFGHGFLHRSMVRPGHFHVHPRCEHWIAAMGRYTGADDEWKHIVDTGRYALDNWVFDEAEKLNLPDWRT